METENLKFRDDFLLSGDGVFHTIQGEGDMVGVPTTFIRLHYCNLNCQWCDTPYTWDKNDERFYNEPFHMSIEELEEEIRQSQTEKGVETFIPHIAFTGGEPFLIYNDLRELIKLASLSGKRVTTITNGYWASNYDLVITKIKELKERGLNHLSISYDSYHSEYIDVNNIRNILKATTLENKFPLFTVENGCIVSKDADITVAFRVELPELFTVTAAEYEAIHSAWNKAVKVLPDYSIVHKQDWFIKENYTPDIQKDDLSFLSRSFERHFNERPFLNHTCYLFLTKTTKERSRMQSNFSTLCRGFLVPKEIKDKETVTKFLEAVGQFESIMNDSGFITLTRLTSDEITGTKETAGIVEKYFSLSQTDTTTLKDIQLNAGDMRIGDDILCLHTLSDAEDMAGDVSNI